MDKTGTSQYPRWLPLAVMAAIAAVVAVATWWGKGRDGWYLLARFGYVLGIEGLVYALRPSGKLQRRTLEHVGRGGRELFAAVLVAAVLLVTLPMSANPFWTPEVSPHLDQYEEMADAILEGHLYIDDGNISPQLLEMENPYALWARSELGVEYEWDHALYNGHYYMYFGVVPSLVLFLPYRLLTGQRLPTVNATRIFTALVALALFVLVYQLARKYCRRMTWGVYLTLSCALTGISTWCFAMTPTLYCTAISAGVCFALWGFILLFQALVLDGKDGPGFWWKVVLGALCSALVFGCRPSIGLFCITYIPMGLGYAWRRREDARHVAKTVAAFCAPFVVVGVALMLYNYARFDNPFEFGQTYQLTSTDQSAYMSSFFQVKPARLLGEVLNYLIYYTPLSTEFPYLHTDGTLVLFPILFLAFTALGGETRARLKRRDLDKLCVGLLVAAFAVMVVDVMWAPWIERRYALDFSFILCILTALAVCLRLDGEKDVRRLKRRSVRLSYLGLYTEVIAVLLFFAPGSGGFADMCPDRFAVVRDFLTLG